MPTGFTDAANDLGLIESTPDDGDRLVEDNYDTETNSLAFYSQLNLNTEWLGKPVRGNLGVRLVHTDFRSSGVVLVNEGDDDTDSTRRLNVSEGNDYTTVLPSLNLAMNLSDNLILRGALARTMRRPLPEATRAAMNIEGVSFDGAGNITSTGPLVATNGNPELDPFIADQVDLGLEYYSESGGLYSLALFYKDIQDLTVLETSASVEDVRIQNPITGAIETVQALISSPVNADGEVKGVELGFQQLFSFLPEPFNGLGLAANYTYIDAEDSEGNPLGGTSDQVYNVAAFYERNNMGLRLAYNFRDAFLEAPERGDSGRFVDATERLDLSAFYQIAKHFTATFEVINLTDEAERSHFDGLGNRLNIYSKTGPRYLAGVSFKFN